MKDAIPCKKPPSSSLLDPARGKSEKSTDRLGAMEEGEEKREDRRAVTLVIFSMHSR